MIKMARKAPVSVLLHPMPDAGSRKKKGRGISNHRSLDPNRKTLDSDSTLMLYLFWNSCENVTFSFRARPSALDSPKMAKG